MIKIGFAGFDGSGKTTLRLALQEELQSRGFSCIGRSVSNAIADYLYDYYGDVVYARPLDPEIRRQFIVRGLEMIDQHGQDYWINKALECHGYDVILVDGIRYPWEVFVGWDALVYLEPNPCLDPGNLPPGTNNYYVHLPLLKANATHVLPYHPDATTSSRIVNQLADITAQKLQTS